MPHLAHIALIVCDYDEALAFYVGKLGFTLVEDSYQPEQDKRWVTIRPPTSRTAASRHSPISAATSHTLPQLRPPTPPPRQTDRCCSDLPPLRRTQ